LGVLISGIRPGLTTVLPLDIARLSMFYNAFQASPNTGLAVASMSWRRTLCEIIGTADGNVQQCDVQTPTTLPRKKA